MNQGELDGLNQVVADALREAGVTEGVARIAAGRQHQVAKGYTPEHDLEHNDGSLARAARSHLAAYQGWRASMSFADHVEEGHPQFRDMDEVAREAVEDPVGSYFGRDSDGRVKPPSATWDEWPWERVSWNPSNDPVENLAVAGALIAAEIDRLLAQREIAKNP